MLQVFQHVLTCTLFHDSITQRGVEAFENAGGKQKCLHILWLASEYFLSQKVQDVALISTDLLKQGGRVSMPSSGKREQLQPH